LKVQLSEELQSLDKSEERQLAVKQQPLARFAPISLRLMLGILFIVHAVLKFTSMALMVQFFSHIGIPLPSIAVPFIASLELVGGVCLILGVGTRIFSALLTIDMIVAISTARLSAGFVGGYEFELTLVAGLVALVLSGPGALALIRNNSLFA
jgi:Predicted membrane protein